MTTIAKKATTHALTPKFCPNEMRSGSSENATAHQGYFSASELRTRGWTDRLIARYLGEPDRTVPNPKINSGNPKRLFAAERVYAIEEAAPEFAAQRERSRSYAERLKVQAQRRGATLQQLAQELQLPDLTASFEELLVSARALQAKEVSCASQPVLRLALEILIDTMNSLNWQLDDFVGQSGVREARKILRRRMLAHIIDRYPALVDAALERAQKEEGSAETW